MYPLRRTIEELIALYEREPSIRDVIVEGPEDVALIDWYIRNRADIEYSIFDIGVIDVPSEYLDAHESLSGNKGRIVVLAIELDNNLPSKSKKCVTLIVDDDYDRTTGQSPEVELLLKTDFTCIEMYLANEQILDKLMSIVLGITIIDSKEALESLSEVLQQLWICKVANHTLNLSMSWVDFTKDCKISKSKITFDRNKFIQKYLVSNGQKKNEKVFLNKYDEISCALEADPRLSMDGHHFMKLARWYLKQHSKNKKFFAHQEYFDRVLFGCIELDTLDKTKLFNDIIHRVSATSH